MIYVQRLSCSGYFLTQESGSNISQESNIIPDLMSL